MKALENLGFVDALRYIKKGLKVERAAWGGRMWLETPAPFGKIMEYEPQKGAQYIWMRPFEFGWEDVEATDWRVRE